MGHFKGRILLGRPDTVSCRNRTRYMIQSLYRYLYRRTVISVSLATLPVSKITRDKRGTKDLRVFFPVARGCWALKKILQARAVHAHGYVTSEELMKQEGLSPFMSNYLVINWVRVAPLMGNNDGGAV